MGPESSDGSVYNSAANTLKDLRDGQTYRTTTISIPEKDYSEVWMAENLNFATEKSICYKDDPDNCTKYGRLYTWAVAMDSAGIWATNGKGCGRGKTCSPTYPVRGVCPKGWHLPSRAEWETLIVAVDGTITEYSSSNNAGTKLKSQTGWNSSGNSASGTDAYSFLALPAGYRNSDWIYMGEGDEAGFWSSTECNLSMNCKSIYAYCIYLSYYAAPAYLYDNIHGKVNGFSIRCLKD